MHAHPWLLGTPTFHQIAVLVILKLLHLNYLFWIPLRSFINGHSRSPWQIGLGRSLATILLDSQLSQYIWDQFNHLFFVNVIRGKMDVVCRHNMLSHMDSTIWGTLSYLVCFVYARQLIWIVESLPWIHPPLKKIPHSQHLHSSLNKTTKTCHQNCF